MQTCHLSNSHSWNCPCTMESDATHAECAWNTSSIVKAIRLYTAA
jgi:hypothetical protein